MNSTRTLRLEIGKSRRTLYVLGRKLTVNLTSCAPIQSKFYSVKCTPNVQCQILSSVQAGNSLLSPQPLGKNTVLLVSMGAASLHPNDSKLSVRFYGDNSENLGSALLHLTAVEISLDVDADRDGVVERNNPNKASWKWGPKGHGAILLVNCDSESSYFKKVDTENEEVSKVS
ncbi:protein-arginine deiminase type-2 isoform X3, partial [Tachysurus ichikawai]